MIKYNKIYHPGDLLLVTRHLLGFTLQNVDKEQDPWVLIEDRESVHDIEEGSILFYVGDFVKLGITWDAYNEAEDELAEAYGVIHQNRKMWLTSEAGTSDSFHYMPGQKKFYKPWNSRNRHFLSLFG